MPASPYTQLTMTEDEATLALCYLRKPTKKAFWQQPIPYILEGTFLKLAGANSRQSLIDKGFALPAEEGGIILNDHVAQILQALDLFDNVIQVIVSSADTSEPEIINIFLSVQNAFSAVRSLPGDRIEITHGEIEHLAQLIITWLSSPPLPTKHIPCGEHPINMSLFSKLFDAPRSRAVEQLKSSGIPGDTAALLAEDTHAPALRAAITLTNLTPETIKLADGSEAGGAGVLVLAGVSGRAWALRYNESNERTVARMTACDHDTLIAIINAILDDYRAARAKASSGATIKA